MKEAERTVCGLAAVEALFAREPDSIHRLFFDEARSRQVARISRHLAAKRRVYRVVPREELERIAGTVHHAGIVAVASIQKVTTPTAADVRAWAAAGELVVVLDRVGNPHNLGAIARTAAFLGVRRLVLSPDPAQARPSDAAYRVAEGGLDHLELHTVENLPRALRSWRAQFEIIGTDVHGALPLTQLPHRTAASRPVMLVLGNEEEGTSPQVLDSCTLKVTIPGTDKVESLNVSAAAAILLWHLRNRV